MQKDTPRTTRKLWSGDGESSKKHFEIKIILC
jgi:hypothetical protein